MVVSRDVDGDKLVVTVEIDPDEFKKEINAAFRRLSSRARVRGFRPGKVPRKIFELYYGKDMLYRDAKDRLIQKYLPTVLEDVGDEIFGEPEVRVEKMEEGLPFVFKVAGWKRPQIDVDYKGIEIPFDPEKWKITDDMVEKTVHDLQEKYASFVSASEDEVKDGLFVSVEYKISVGDGGKTYEEKEALIDVSEDSVFFGSRLLGMKKGEEKSYDVDIPEDFANKKIAGKKVHCWVKVNDILQKKLPDVDADFISMFGFETMDEFYKHVRKELELELEKQKRAFKEDRLFSILKEKVSVDIPEVLIEQEKEQVKEDEVDRWERMGVDRDTYMKVYEKNADKMDEDFKERARERILTRLILDYVAEKEGIEVSDEEYERKLHALAKEFDKDVVTIKKVYETDYIMRKKLLDSLKRENSWRWIVDASELVAEKVSENMKEEDEANVGTDSDRA